jgi:hypothetical protein
MAASPIRRCLQKITLQRRTQGVEKKGEQPPEETMRNITVTIPDDAYHRASIWAAERDTSVSAVVKYLLETLPTLPALRESNRDSRLLDCGRVALETFT